jgi:hypothetical protein
MPELKKRPSVDSGPISNYPPAICTDLPNDGRCCDPQAVFHLPNSHTAMVSKQIEASTERSRKGESPVPRTTLSGYRDESS